LKLSSEGEKKPDFKKESSLDGSVTCGYKSMRTEGRAPGHNILCRK
jgi:hypothetical protein